MGFGDTAKKLQKVTNAAEDLYDKMNQLRGQIQSLREEVETTSEQVDRIERDISEQRALLEALAEQQDLDVETIVDEISAAETAEEDEQTAANPAEDQ